MTTLKLCGTVALLLSLLGCDTYFVRAAYVSPDGKCGYRVYLAGPPGDGNVRISACMSLNDARELADKLNVQMVGKWSDSSK